MTRLVHERLMHARTLGWGFALAAFVGTFPGRAQSQPTAPQYSDVYLGGEGGYQTYRIPSVIATAKRTLLAFAEARRTGAGDAGDIDLVIRRSHDGGRSWSPMQVVGDNGPNTFGNPCPVVDGNTGAIWLLTTQNRGTDREKDIIAGTSEASRTVWALKSADEGVTWSTPVEITASVKRPDWTWYATGPGIGIQTTSGRLVIPANHAEAGTGVHRSHLFFSDDGGRSATTKDRNRLLFANPASTKRERLTVRLSYDEGKSWPVARVIHEGPAAYSSLVALPPMSIGLLFERGDRSPYERISFARFSLDGLTEGKDR